MYVLVAKIPVDLEGAELSAEHDERFYRHLGAKIRARYRVCAHIYRDGEQVALVVTALARHRDVLSQLCEQICALCEREGLGRVAVGEAPLIAHIDSLS